MRILILFGCLALALGEAPAPYPAAPYPASGWKPSKPFNFPNEHQQNYGPPKQEYAPPTQAYGTPTQKYGPPKQQEVYPSTRQELPDSEPSKSWQEYGPPPTVQPSISWEIPDDSLRFLPNNNLQPNQQYGPPSTETVITQEQIPNGTPEEVQDTDVTLDEQEVQRVLEQIVQYRLKASRQQKLRLRNQLGRLRANLQAQPRSPQRSERLQKQRARINNRFRSERLEDNPLFFNEEEVQQGRDDQVNTNGNGYPQTGYPIRGYQPPTGTYGPPSLTTEQPVEITTEARTEYIPETTTEPILTPEESQPEPTTDEEDGEGNVAVSTAVATNAKQGQYYILQPNGRLQRITYRTQPDPKNKNAPLVSNLKYEAVKPIEDPIYSYQNGQIVRIN